jgi:hypothetical protein
MKKPWKAMNLPGSLRSEKRLNPAHPQWISPVLKLLKPEFFTC